MFVSLLFLLSVSLNAAGPNPAGEDVGGISRRVLSRLRRGHSGFIVQYAEQGLATNPENRELSALLGAAYTNRGRISEAIALFEYAEGSAFYEAIGIRYHANALRQLGDAEHAAALRTEHLLFQDLTVDAEHQILLGRIEDYRVVGEYSKALAMAEEATRWYGDRPAYYGAMADVYVAMGALGQAEVCLAIAERLAAETYISNVNRAQARLWLARGYPEIAAEVLAPHRRSNPTSQDYWSLLAESRRQTGETDKVSKILEMRRFSETFSPPLIVVEAKLLRDQGDMAAAEALMSQALKKIPTSPILLQGAQDLERASVK